MKWLVSLLQKEKNETFQCKKIFSYILEYINTTATISQNKVKNFCCDFISLFRSEHTVSRSRYKLKIKTVAFGTTVVWRYTVWCCCFFRFRDPRRKDLPNVLHWKVGEKSLLLCVTHFSLIWNNFQH